ncbi:hypothetical protein RKD18_008053 [Streptomyces phaeoluteigriseus]
MELIDLLDPDNVRFPQFHRRMFGDEEESTAVSDAS